MINSDTIIKTLAAAGSAVVILIMAFTQAFSQETRKEYFKFSHQYHIEDVGADCETCHESIQESSLSSDRVIPGHDECFACHDGDTASDDCLTCHYNEDDIQLSPAKEYEFLFSHESHLAQDDVECATCHAGLEETDYATAANMPDMASCVECHNNTRAPQNCNFCHTQLSTLRPLSHTPAWINRHNEAARTSSDDCATCHQVNFCQECHEGGTLVKSNPAVLSNNPPDAPQNWDFQNRVFQRNHPLNFLYTHPLEARNNQLRCQTCHETETFCNECHDAVGNSRDITPSWHGGPGWGALALGLGSGGGRHAQLAKQDISQCASCHEANGEDPTCLQCHMDRNPGRNNDLRTHSSNTFRNVKGPWHNDESYTCFTCHINAQRNSPTSFCTYCHGLK